MYTDVSNTRVHSAIRT